MSANLPLLVMVVVLLWLPRSWLRAGRSLWTSHRKHRGVARVATLQNGSMLSVRREFRKPRNFYDLVRAFAATTALLGAYGFEPALRATAGASAGTVRNVQLIQAAILGVGVIAQTVRWERRRFALAAPVFFITGLTFGLGAPIAALSAAAVAWVLSGIVSNAQGFLTIQMLVYLGVGIPLSGPSPFLALGGGLLFFPVLISLLSRRALVVFTRRATHASTRDD